MSKKILLLLFIKMVANSAFCQSYSIKGVVEGREKPLIAATVSIATLHKSILTDSLGHFEFTGMKAGKYLLTVSVVGYDEHKMMVSVQEKNDELLISLKETNTAMNEVVVSGTMRPVSKMSSPIPVEVFTPAFFKKNPSPNIFESLQMVNGIQPQLNCNVCNTGDIHINGMEGPYTMILIDGMPIVSGLSTVYGLAGIPNSMVKRIEVVKGPASTLYGSEAVGGLVNIITKDAAQTEKIKVDMSATSIGEYNTDITSAFKMRKVSTILGINYFNYQQKRDINHDNFTDVTLQNRISIFNKWNFKISKQRSGSIAFRYINENRWGGELQWKPAFKGTDSIYGESINTNRAEIIGTVDLKKNISFDLSYNYHLQDSYYGRVKYYATQQVAFAQLRWRKNFGKHDLLSGFPFRYTFYDDNSSATSINGKNKPALSYLPGIFVQDEWSYNSKLTILSGIRYDYNNEHGSIYTPRLSFKYSPNADNTIRLGGGNGYRVVNLFTEDHAALTGARDVVIAHALKPERSWNVNLNYTRFIRHKNGFVGIDASLFYTYFTNKIVGDFITDPNKIIYDNLKGYAISKGATINIDANFMNGLKIITGATLMDVYQINKDQQGNNIKTPQLFAPKISATFAISYGLKRAGVTIDLTGKLNGPMYLPVVPNDFRPARSPFYSILNLQLTKAWKHVEIYAGVKNFLNFLPKNPLLHPDDPFDKAGGKYFDNSGTARPDTNPYNYVFDPSYNYAAVQGAKGFIGIRWQVK
jgi:outer membrane receptor for ferrienterochelin and colicins